MASLIGDEVSAGLSTGIPSFTVTPFTSPQVVGGGTEFTGGLQFPGGQLSAEIQLDVWDNGFTLTGLSDNWGSQLGTDSLRIDLTDLDWVGTPGEIVGLNDDGGTWGVQDSGFTSDSAFVIFDLLDFSQTGESHSFSFETRHLAPVPLPAALPLLGAGLFLMGAVGRRRKRG